MRDSISRKSRSRMARPDRLLAAYAAGADSARTITGSFSDTVERLHEASCSTRPADCSALISCAISLYREVQELRGRRISRAAGKDAKVAVAEARPISMPATETVDHGRKLSERCSATATAGALFTGSAGATAVALGVLSKAGWNVAVTTAAGAGFSAAGAAAIGTVRTGRFATFTGVPREAVLSGICTTTSATAAAAVTGAIHFRLRANPGRTRAQPCGRFTSAASCFWRRPRSNSAQNSGAGRSARLKRSSSSSVGRGDGCCGAEPMVSVSTNPANQPAAGAWRSGDASGPFPPYTP